MLRSALRASPVHFGATVLYLLEVGQEAESMLEGPASTFADTFVEFDVAETTNALHVIAGTTADEVQAAKIRRTLEGRRQPVHPVVRDFGRVEVTEALIVGEDFTDGEHIALLMRWPDGTEAALLTMIKYGAAGDFIGDVILDEGGHEVTKDMLRNAGGPDVRVEPIPLAEAAATLIDAAAGYVMLPPDERPVTESWPALHAFLAFVANAVPKPDEDEGEPEGEAGTHTP